MNPILALIIANSIWGGASPIFKFALENIPPFTLAFIRFFFAGLLFIPFVLSRWQKLEKKDWFQIILGGIFGITINISFFFLGLQRSESINAPVISSSAPVFLFIFSVFLLKEKPKLKIFIGMLISLVGVLGIIFSPILFYGKQFMMGEVVGNLFFVIATLGFVGHALVYKTILKKINSYQVTMISFLFCSLTFLPFMGNELQTWSFSSLNVHGWLGIFYGIFFSSAIAYFLMNYGISKIKAQEVGLFSYIDPVVAVMIAIPLLGEIPSVYFFISSFLVFFGIFIAEGRIHWHPIGVLLGFFKKYNGTT
jgi:drug/metabolite transporter (DMT)-like permease